MYSAHLLGMPRDAHILSLLQPGGRGLEIGPGYNPFLPKAKGHRVESVDHAPAEALRRKYLALGQDVSRIEEVDYVWTGQPLDELVPHHGAYDFVLASHVVEHLPDPLGFLNACDRLLRPGGVLVLVAPDKRRCFDALRPIASTGDVVQAGLERRQRHPPGKVFDHTAYYAAENGAGTWYRRRRGATALAREDIDEARRAYQAAADSAGYVDVHGWVFVPSSLRLILADLHGLGLTAMREVAFIDRGLGRGEFYLSLSRSGAGCPVSRSELCRRIAREQAVRVVGLGSRLSAVVAAPRRLARRIFTRLPAGRD